MTSRLPLILGAVAFATSLGASNLAEAGRRGGGFHGGGGGGVSVGGGGGARVHFGGSFHWSGGVHVGPSYSRPAWRPHTWGFGGSVYVGPRYYYPRPYYYYPSYVPSYYGYSQSYYPVEASAAPGIVAVAPVREPLPRLGMGLFMGGSQVEAQDGGSVHDSNDIGLLGRFRLTPGLILEGELGKTSYDQGNYDNVRVDRRLGASLLYEVGAYNRWAPYVLAGAGVQQADTAGVYETTQDFVEVGLGLRWAVSRQFHLAFDIRAGSRSTVSDNTSTSGAVPAGTSARTITPPSASSGDSEEYTRGRLSAILYF